MTKNEIISNDLNLALAVCQNNFQAVTENFMEANTVVSEPEVAAEMIKTLIEEGMTEKAFGIMNVPFIESDDEITAIYREILGELQAKNIEITNTSLASISELYRFYIAGQSTTATSENGNKPLIQPQPVQRKNKPDFVQLILRVAAIAIFIYVLYILFIK